MYGGNNEPVVDLVVGLAAQQYFQTQSEQKDPYIVILSRLHSPRPLELVQKSQLTLMWKA